ncbi:hypothetical protein Q3G72_009690 [Acer saccharum]|nr:hypothetical protein Q3G72_009690 [Acer saccharum]
MDGQSFEQVLVPTGARLTDAGFSLSMRGTSPIRDSLGPVKAIQSIPSIYSLSDVEIQYQLFDQPNQSILRKPLFFVSHLQKRDALPCWTSSPVNTPVASLWNPVRSLSVKEATSKAAINKARKPGYLTLSLLLAKVPELKGARAGATLAWTVAKDCYPGEARSIRKEEWEVLIIVTMHARGRSSSGFQAFSTGNEPNAVSEREQSELRLPHPLRLSAFFTTFPGLEPTTSQLTADRSTTELLSALRANHIQLKLTLPVNHTLSEQPPYYANNYPRKHRPLKTETDSDFRSGSDAAGLQMEPLVPIYPCKNLYRDVIDEAIPGQARVRTVASGTDLRPTTSDEWGITSLFDLQ